MSRPSAVLLALALTACSRDLSLPARTSMELSEEGSGAQVAPLGRFDFHLLAARLPLELVVDRIELPSFGFDAPSLPEIDGATVHYRAGRLGDVTDRFVVRDASGAQLEIRVGVRPALRVDPSPAIVAAGGEQLFTLSGGQREYGFEPPPCGESCLEQVDESTFRYRAPEVQSREVLVFVDANGVRVPVEVTVGPELVLVPSEIRIAPGGKLRLQALGGTGPLDWRFSVVGPPGQPAPEGIRLEGDLLVVDTAVNVEPGSPVDARVQLEDAGRRADRGNAVYAPVDVTDPLRASEVDVRPGETVQLEASGGTPPYRFSFARNRSGGSLTILGRYTSGFAGKRVIDEITVRDVFDVEAHLVADVFYSGLDPAEYQGVFPRPRRSREPAFGFRGGHLFAPGVHLQLRSDGRLVPRAFPRGRIHDVSDLDGDGATDVLLGTDPEAGRTRVFAYTGQLDGEVALRGGGERARAAAALVDGAGTAVLLRDTAAGCAVAVARLGAFLQEVPPACAPLSPRAPSFLLGTGTGVAVEVGGAAGATFWRLVRTPEGEPGVETAGACASGDPEEFLAPVVGDLDGDGRVDVAYVEERADRSTLVACLQPAPGGTAVRVALRLPDAHRAPVLHLGPSTTRQGARVASVLLDARTRFPQYRIDMQINQRVWSELLGIPAHDEDHVLGTGDADGDGELDVVTVAGNGEINLRFGNHAGNVDETRRYTAGPTPDAYRLLAGDADADGSEELAVSGLGSLRVLAGPGLDTWGSAPERLVGAAVGLADWAAGGRLEVVATVGYRSVRPFALEEDRRQLEPAGDLHSFPEGDVAFDLAPPLVARAGAAPALLVPILAAGRAGLAGFELLLPGAAGTTTALALPTPTPALHPLVADVTGDGRSDVLLLEPCGEDRPDCPVTRPIDLHVGQGDGPDFVLSAARTLGTVGALPGGIVADAGRAFHVALTGCDVDRRGCRNVRVDLFPVEGAPSGIEVDVPAGLEARIPAGGFELVDVDHDGAPELVVALSAPGGARNHVGFLPLRVDAGGGLELSTLEVQQLAEPWVDVSFRVLRAPRTRLVALHAPRGDGVHLPVLHRWVQRAPDSLELRACDVAGDAEPGAPGC